MSRCSVVIPVHGRPGLTARCLDALLAVPDAVREIIVVDDASPPETEEALRPYGESIHRIRLDRNRGFAGACNRGAEAASGDLLCFLNNDVLPRPGWLDALVEALDRSPEVAVAGSKLLYPDGTIQHAGVVFGQDGQPRHIYAGFPADHPAVSRERPYRAVTAASMVVRRALFDAVGGFDTGYRNGLEDVDLCLRLGEAGHGVRYVPTSVAEHLESVSRGRGSPEIKAGIERFQRRWRGRVRPDDLARYVEDGLLEVAYDDAYPVRLRVSPQLAALDGQRAPDVERELVRRSRHIADLLRDVVELTARLAERRLTAEATDPERDAPGPVNGHTEPDDVDARIADIEDRIRGLQAALADETDALTAPTPALAYRGLVARVRQVVDRAVPARAVVAVISRGDDELLELGDRIAWHYPRAEDGRFAGHYPADGTGAVAHLDTLRLEGARYLVVPAPSRWWLEAYPELRRRLDGTRVDGEPDVATVYALADTSQAMEA